MKKIFVLFIVLLMCTSAFSDGRQRQYDKVVLVLTDGRVYDIDIDKESHIYSYTKEVEGALVQFVEVNGKNEVYLFERRELKSIKFVEAISTYIEELQDEISSNPIRFINGELVFGEDMAGETYCLYDAAGKKLLQGVVKKDSPVVLDNLPTGFYLAVVSGYKLKVMVR